MTLTVVGPVRTRTARVLWCLEELGLPFEHQTDRPHSEAVNALNPLRQVPILIDGDTVLTDSLAILHYLADRAGRLTHAPGTAERARMDARINFVITEMEAPLWLKARHSYVLPEDARHPEIFPLCEADFFAAERNFAKLLGEAEYFAGPDFTIADIMAGHVLNWAEGTGYGSSIPAVRAYLDRMRARPGWEASRRGL